jgi:hypothetical protein
MWNPGTGLAKPLTYWFWEDVGVRYPRAIHLTRILDDREAGIQWIIANLTDFRREMGSVAPRMKIF